MSAAEALSRLRAAQAPRAKPFATPSLLYATPREAAKVSRAEIAGLALNGLDSLSSIDRSLPSLYEPLLLHSPAEDRSTLPPPREKAVSAAIISLASSLCPAFPLRHAQKALEWVLRGLHLPTLGSDAEVDAVLLSALPFHATTSFARLAHAVLHRSTPRPRWAWLRPVVEQRKPASLDFVVDHAPPALLHAALRFAAVLVRAGVSAVAFSSFLANVVGRRLSRASGSAQQRRQLLLQVLESVDIVRKERAASRRKAQAEVLSSLFTCIAAAVPAGVDEDVGDSAVQAAAFAVLKLERRTAASDTALHCLALLLTRSAVNGVPPDAARYLLSSGTAAELFPRLGDPVLVRRTYLACIATLLRDWDGDVIQLEIVKTAVLVSSSELLSSVSVATVLVRLFTVLSQPRKGADGEKSIPSEDDRMVQVSIELLAPLARGRYAEGMDRALREHFDSRTKKKLQRGCYYLIDKVLGSALSGTSFEILKVASGEEGRKSRSSDTLLGMLSHPEAVVRKACLQRLADEGDTKGNLDGVSWKELTQKLMDICRDERDLESAAFAVQCLLELREQCDTLAVLGRSVERLRSEQMPSSKKKRKKMKKKSHVAGLQPLARHIVSGGEQCVDANPLCVQAMLIGLVMEASLPKGDSQGALQTRIRNLLFDRQEGLGLNWPVETSQELTVLEALSTALNAKIEQETWDCVGLVRSLSSWDPTWSLKVLQLWVAHLSEPLCAFQCSGTAAAILRGLSHLYENYAEIRNEVVQLAANATSSLCRVSGSDASLASTLDRIWYLIAQSGDEAALKCVLRSGIECTGLSEVVQLLRRAVWNDHKRSEDVNPVSLKWYLGICELDDSAESQCDTVVSILSLMYGSRSLARDEVIAFCRSVDVAPMKKRKKKKLSEVRRLIAFLGEARDFSNQAVQPIVPAISHAGELCSLLSRYRRLDGYSFPIDAQAVDLTSVFDRILDLETPATQRLALLRAIGTSRLLAVSCNDKLIRLIQHLLNSLFNSELETAVIIESLAFANLQFFQLGSAEQQIDMHSLVQTVLEKLRELNDVASFGSLQVSDLQLATVATAAGIFALRMACEEIKTEDRELFAFLLTYSLKSSSAGKCSRKTLDSIAHGRLLQMIVPYLSSLVQQMEPVSKRARIAPEDTSLSHVQGPIKDACLGAVETVRRIAAASKLKNGISGELTFSTPALLAPLWKFVIDVTSLSREEVVDAKEEMAYKLELVLSTLKLVHEVRGQRDGSDSCIDFSALANAVFYPSHASEDSETAWAFGVKRAALQVFNVLAPFYAEQLRQAIEPHVGIFVRDGHISDRLRRLHELTPSLLSVGCEFRLISEWLLTIIYDGGARSELTREQRGIMAACCRFCPDWRVSIGILVRGISLLGPRFFKSEETVARECSLMLFECEEDVSTSLKIIAELNGGILGKTARYYVLQPTFLSQLLSELKDQQYAFNEVLTGAFMDLLLALLTHDGGTDMQDCIATVLAVLPLAPLSTCLRSALSHKDPAVQMRTLQALSERLSADDVALCYNLRFIDGSIRSDEKAQKSAEEYFVTAVGKCLQELVREGNESTADIDVVPSALSCLEKMSKRLGTSCPQAVLKLTETVLDVSGVYNDLETPELLNDPRLPSSHIAGSLLCLSSMIGALRKHSVSFIPAVMHRSVEILKFVFAMGPNERNNISSETEGYLIAMAEGAVKACITVLETNPRFFGRNSFQSIVSLALSSGADVLKELAQHAAEKVPPNVFVVALSGIASKLQEMGLSAEGLSTYLRVFNLGVRTMRKSELKLHIERLLDMALTCLGVQRNTEGVRLRLSSPAHDDIRRSTASGNKKMSETDDVYDFLSACRKVDDEFATAVTSIVLRLSESEFKEVFKKLLRWQDGGGLPPDEADLLCANNEKSCRTLLRAVPFYRVCLQLFRTLQAIFFPFFVQVLDPVISAIEMKNLSIPGDLASIGNGLKRGRSVVENEGIQGSMAKLIGLVPELRSVCLDNLILFLRQDAESYSPNATLIGKIQAALITRFDGEKDLPEQVERAFEALGSRIVASGNVEASKEESRGLLMSLSREILLRTRSPSAAIRKASLLCAKSVASAVGEEYLVSLPEAMPVLSEVIDDEVPEVQKAARSFVHVLEDLSGEPILPELQ